MKKSLLLAAAALIGLAPQASAMVQLTNDNCATELKDGHVLALQCLDTNGGLWKFWNGCRTKSETLNPEQGLLQIEFIEGGVRDGRQTFYLKDYKNPTNYLQNKANNENVAWTTDKDAAAVWTAYVPVNSGANYDTWSTKPLYLNIAQNTVRFDKGNTSFLNTNDKNGTPWYKPGKGGYSYWYAYVFTPEEAANMTVSNAPKMITCNYLYESPKRDGVYFKGMSFGALEGVDLSNYKYHEYYEGAVENFSKLALVEGQDMVVTEDNKEFYLSMTPSDTWEAEWTAWMEKYESFYHKVHRATIKPSATESYISYSNIYEDELRSQNPNKLFGAGHFWYLKYAGLDMYGDPAVQFMSVQFHGSEDENGEPIEKGIAVNNSDDSHAVISDNPTIFSMYTPTVSGHQENDFVLGIVDMNTASRSFLNDRTQTVQGPEDASGQPQNFTVHFMSTWLTTRDNAIADAGCLIRFLPIDDDEFDQYQIDVYDSGYNEYLDTHDNGVDITDEAIAKAKETREPEDVTVIFPENMNLINGLRTYKEYTGIAFYENRRINGVNGEVDFYGIPGYVQNGADALYDALDKFSSRNKATWKPVAEARWALVNGNPAIEYDLVPGAIFALENFEDTRGFLVNDGGVLRCSVNNANPRTYDPKNPDKDFQFTFVKVGDKLYMYNLGAEKFMNAFGEKSDRKGPVAEAVTDHTWQFSDVPTEIRGAFAHSGNAHTFSIAGGMVSGTDDGSRYGDLGHEGGITMMNDCERGVLVTLGNSNREDGSGLLADYVGFVSDEDYQAIVAKAEAAIAAIPSESTDWADIDGIVNHIDKDTFDQIAGVATDENKAIGGGQHDHIHYVISQGSRQGFESDKVYNFFVNATDALKVKADGTLETAEFDAENTSFNLKVVPAAAAANVYMDGPAETYNFMHTIDEVETAISHNGTTEHALDMSELGKVKLNGQTLIAKVGTGNASTTEISEINAASASAVVYDLQGRRLAAPAKGINIINGTKVLIK